ncbi:MAG TPA: stalk domain-containing protein [Syntrophomonadaceae bacterium]|nr:stalk domain-containing protein [Syntrophomonadaceae bacterium]HQE24369.1 stalk domain-containing protein [Syntrophomonadaceae bacterium]
MKPVAVSVDDKPVSFTGQTARFDSGKDVVLIPLRTVCEALGAQVEWDGGAPKASVRFMNKNVEIHINSRRGTVNGKEFVISADAGIMNEHIMVPLDFMQKALGSKITSDEGQSFIGDFKKDVYGESMFFPNAEGWGTKN